jgi:hypothetical protein
MSTWNVTTAKTEKQSAMSDEMAKTLNATGFQALECHYLA